MKLTDVKFKRRFSVNYYRNLKLPMGEMSFHKDWISAADRGDPYPITARRGGVCESVCRDRYTLDFENGGSVQRLMGAFFPWLTYDIEYETLAGDIGAVVTSRAGDASITLSSDGALRVKCSDKEHKIDVGARSRGTLSIEFRGLGVSVYFIEDGVHELLLDVGDDYFVSLTEESVLADTKIHLFVGAESGKTVIKNVNWYLHAGISQADLRPIKYEDGSAITENGRIYLTVSARCTVRTFQAILSWCPTTCNFKLEGAIFFNTGNGCLSADVASCVIYDRISKKWRIATWSDSCNHTVCMGESISDPRFGISIIDTTPMTPAKEGDDRREFLGFEGDEDPDMILVDGVWRFAVCRSEDDGYHYYHFTSEDLVTFEFSEKTNGKEKTGGSYVKTADGVYFVCGSDFKKRAVYDVYTLDNLSEPIMNINTDYDDGGFRGWGSIMLLPVGSRYRYVWITFDRQLGSSYNWSYGNIHVFDSDPFKI